MQSSDPNLETKLWSLETGPNVNPVPADAYIASLESSGDLKVTCASSKPLGGALVTCKRASMPYPGVQLPFLGLDMMAFVGVYDLPNLGRWELDLKNCVVGAPSASTPIRNVVNGSSQVNMSTGQWQIDGDPPGWQNTGFKPTIMAGVWFPIKFRYHVDFPNSKFSFLSVQWGNQNFSVPPGMQNVPFQMTNWQPVSAIQLQMEVMNPGSVTTLYESITLTWSDSQF
jgi:hypothetical protein